MDYRTYFQQRRTSHLDELKEFLSIPSISALNEHRGHVREAAIWLSNALKNLGMEKVEVIETKGHPIVYAEHCKAIGAPTVLVYGHYDVQPVDPISLWSSPPFEPRIENDKIYARGATDDKGQLFLHLKAIEAIQKKHGTLPFNVKFCIEGEEEIGSPHLSEYLEAQREKLQADVVLVSDTSLLAKGKPAICIGLRGIVALELFVKTANKDLHSGTYGGAVPNAIHALVSLLESLHDMNGRVNIEGFYRDVAPLSAEEREEFAKIPFDEQHVKQELALSDFFGENGYTFHERVGARPTLEINGITGGFQGEGAKTVLPCEASAKITCRLVSKQDPGDILNKVERHLQTYAPSGAQVTVVKSDKGYPFTMDPTHPMLQKAADAYEKVYAVRPVFTKDGGSIPIVEAFARHLQSPVVLMGFGLSEENLHAPDEHFHLENFDKGLLTIVEFLEHIH